MPELPEVETMRRGLQRSLVGKTITRIRVRETRLRHPVNAAKLRKWALHQSFQAFERRAKYLLCQMENDAHLIVHLGMSGRLLWCGRDTPVEKHDHLQLFLDDDSELRFRDPRRFGMFDAVAPGRVERYKHFQHLGVEPLSRDFSADYFFSLSQKLSRPIKNFLMDGTRVVGVGNIYASEALFRAGIHPQKPSGKLKLDDWKNLVDSIRDVLKLAIANGGTTLNDFYNSDGEMGYFQQHLKVYDREGKNCDACGGRIKRIVQVGRSSFFCPKCQRKR